MRLTATFTSLTFITTAIAVPMVEVSDQWRSSTVPSVSDHEWKAVVHSALKSVAAVIGWNDLPVMEAMDDLFAPPENDKSVYQWLKTTDRFSNISKLIDYDEEIVKLLDQSSHGLTFFAPNNDAFPKRRPRHDGDDGSLLEQAVNSPEELLSNLLQHGEKLMKGGNVDDDDDKKKIFKKILHEVLLYHTLPTSVKIESVNKNFTLATELKADDGSYNGQRRRIKIEHTAVPPSTVINKYVKVVSSDSAGTNGIVHEINHPLLPPPAVFEVAYMIPKYFSTFTTAVQKVGLEKSVNYKWNNQSHKFEGAPVITAFVPSNDAFGKLPERLLLYLFSPFGQNALIKLLKFHIVPNFIVHSEWIHNAKDKKPGEDFHVAGTEFEFSFPFPTALGSKYTLPVHIKKTTPVLPVPGVTYLEFTVQDQNVDYKDADWISMNGAVHVVSSVLNPRYKREDAFFSDSEGWDNWEEWLPKWAAEQD